MRSALKVVIFAVFCLSLANCSMFSKSEDTYQPETEGNEEVPKYDNYHSSGIYQDIEGESRSVSSSEYSDDEYGDVDGESEGDTDEDELYLSSGDEGGESQASAVEEPVTQDPLPVEKLETPKKKKKMKKKKKKVGAAFKNGMYRVSVNCTMRKKPSTAGKKAGTVKKGKKLWMEGHNKNWVKVYKKSGPVFINKLCL